MKPQFCTWTDWDSRKVQCHPTAFSVIYNVYKRDCVLEIITFWDIWSRFYKFFKFQSHILWIIKFVYCWIKTVVFRRPPAIFPSKSFNFVYSSLFFFFKWEGHLSLEPSNLQFHHFHHALISYFQRPQRRESSFLLRVAGKSLFRQR